MIVLDNLPTSMQSDYALAYETRAVHDTATLNLRDYLSKGQPDWIIGIVKPAPGSGSATVPGGYLKAETGEFVAPAQGGAVVVKSGHWRSLGAASGAAPPGGQYAWTEALARHARAADPEDFYSPFSYGGAVVFMQIPNASGRDEFAHARLMLPTWEALAPQALRAAPRLLELSDQLTTRASALQEIGGLVADPNGLTAAMALRVALQSTSALAQRSGSLLAAADVRRLSVFTYLILAMSTTERAQWAAQLANQVQATSDPDRFTAMAYAAFAVTLFKPQSPDAIEDARRLLQLLNERTHTLKLQIAPQGHLALIFKKSGLP